ncbi:MAG TPA: cytochrome c oxidase assembly protein [Burkholderiaceae bacterium]|nr:cytochrome c oxidase assembly protein [Burkholderiaceae bacterium]
MSRSGPDAHARFNLHTLGKLALLAVLMFGFGFAMVPLYKAICEVTGVNLLTKEDRDAAEFARNTQVDTSRRVTVEFDANHQGPWRFRPEKRSVEVHPGELVTIGYELINTEAREMSGQAIPSYAPQVSAQYFRKLECFCFRQQALGANEVKRFPVVFVVDPKLPENVTTITLSYTFFEVGAGVQPQTGAARTERGG